MSSTNDTDQKIKTLFDEHIVVNSGKHYLLTAIDKQAASYYEAPKHPEQVYFSFIDTSSQAGLATYLEEFWKGIGTPEFSAMGKGLSELAFELSADHDTQSEDVSPFVYTMY